MNYFSKLGKRIYQDDNYNQGKPINFKLVLTGNSSVGKSSLVNRLLGKNFLSESSTIGAAFSSLKSINLTWPRLNAIMSISTKA